MEVMFDKSFVSGNLSTPAGGVDLTEGMDPQDEDNQEVQQEEDPGDSSEAVRHTKRKGKRGRAMSDGNPYYTAYKSALDKLVAQSCETSSTTVRGSISIPSIADCM